MGSIYDADIKRLIGLLLPMRWRREGLMSLAGALTEPIAGMPAELKGFKAECEHRMGYTGQVCRLRGLLNDVFDASERRITVTDAKGDGVDRYLFVYARKETRPVPLPKVIRERANPALGIWDFEVNVPIGLKPKEVRIKSIINEYKLASKRYKINYI